VRVLGVEFDPLVAGATLLVGAVAVALVYLLRDVLVEAPAAAFGLLFTVTIGGLFVVAWLAGRR
jgi:hypothetical protein